MSARNQSIIWDAMVENIIRLRVAMKLSTKEINRRAGFPDNYLERIESRVIRRPHFKTIERIANALKVETDDIMDGTYHLTAPIHQRLRWLREKNGLNRPELADLSGISKTVLTDLENNKRQMWIDLAYKLAMALKVRTYDLVGEQALTPPAVIKRKDPDPRGTMKRILQKMQQNNQDFEQSSLNALQYYSRQARDVEQALEVLDKL